MKYLIFGTLALLLLLSQTTQAQQWEELSPSDVANSESSIARDLLEVSIAYVKQKGKFESKKAPFPGDYYKGGYDDTKYERRNTSTVTYYRYNFLLEEEDGPSTVNATTIISYNPSNSNFVVTNYSYNIDYNGNEEEATEGLARSESVLIDTRTLTGDGDLASVVSDSFNSIVADHIEGGTLPDAEYTIQFVYGAYSFQYDGDQEINVNEEGEINEEVGGEQPTILEEEVTSKKGEEGEEQPDILIIEEMTPEEEERGEEEEGDKKITEEAERTIEEEEEGDKKITEEAERTIEEEEEIAEEEEGTIDEEESSGPQPGYKYYEIWLKAKNSEGKYYLIVLDIHYTKENGKFVLDKSRTWGGIELRE